MLYFKSDSVNYTQQNGSATSKQLVQIIKNISGKLKTTVNE